MKVFFTLILYITTFTTSAQTSFNYKDDFIKVLTKTKDSNDNFFYDKLLKRFTNNDPTLTNLEVLALLIGFTDKPEYKPYQDIETERAIYGLNREKKYREGFEQADKFLKTHPLSVKAIFEKAYSLHKLGQEDSAKYYVYQGQSIFKAMYFSGNGKTTDTPTFALGPADGQDYILKFAGGNLGKMGSGRDKYGNFLDVLEAKYENGKTISLYFIIQHAVKKMFNGKSIEEVIKSQNKKSE